MTERNPIPACLSHLEQSRRALLLDLWHVAKDSCLLLPDGGSPTVGECLVSMKMANHIRSLIPDSALPFLEIYGSSGQ